VSGAPALTGCDSQRPGTCDSDMAFATEDISPEETRPGATAGPSSCVTVEYVGRLPDGSGTFDEGEIETFFLDGRAGLLYAFILGITNQRVGQTRRVTIPPALAYGNNTRPARAGTVGGEEDGEPFVDIPSCSTLEFDITLTEVFSDRRKCCPDPSTPCE
jgi:FKBP-type peptidyl-prolyl cis-trans isomerase